VDRVDIVVLDDLMEVVEEMRDSIGAAENVLPKKKMKQCSVSGSLALARVSLCVWGKRLAFVATRWGETGAGHVNSKAMEAELQQEWREEACEWLEALAALETKHGKPGKRVQLSLGKLELLPRSVLEGVRPLGGGIAERRFDLEFDAKLAEEIAEEDAEEPSPKRQKR
jgi:hypothetical protein